MDESYSRQKSFLFEGPKFTIIVNGNKIVCEKRVLENIQYFKTLLKGKYKETDTHTLIISNRSHECVCDLLEFARVGFRRTTISITEFSERYALADQWQYEEYLSYLETILPLVLTEANFIALLPNLNFMKRIHKIVEKFIHEHPNVQQTFSELSSDEIEILAECFPRSPDVLIGFLKYANVSTERAAHFDDLIDRLDISGMLETRSWVLSQIPPFSNKVIKKIIEPLKLIQLKPKYTELTDSVISLNQIDLNQLKCQRTDPGFDRILYRDQKKWLIELSNVSGKFIFKHECYFFVIPMDHQDIFSQLKNKLQLTKDILIQSRDKKTTAWICRAGDLEKNDLNIFDSEGKPVECRNWVGKEVKATVLIYSSIYTKQGRILISKVARIYIQ